MYLRWRDRLDSARFLLIPILFFAFSGTLDALVTMHGTRDAPWRERNDAVRPFLEWGGWWGQCLATAAWIIGWSLFVDGLESLRRRLTGHWAALLNWGRLLTVYALAVGHLDGFLSWTHSPVWLADLFSVVERFLQEKAAWLEPISPFGWPLYIGLLLGGLCALVHLGAVSLLERSGASQRIWGAD